ncbi:MAG: hypothetical protein QOE58_3623 [Actinomycetota bacterium]|jgi:hypothetical protein|nr:hypothetical protein [Actinomycetota bacterium]
MPKKRRALRESALYEQQCGDLGVSIRRLDEITGAARWAATEDAELFPEAFGTPYRGIALAATEQTPALRVYFTIDDVNDVDGYVDFVWLEVVKGDPDEPIP